MIKMKSVILILCLTVPVFIVSGSNSAKPAMENNIGSEILNKYKDNDKKPVWMIGNDIINKINAGEFADVEKYIDKLVTQKPYTVDGTRVLEDLYSFIRGRLYSQDMLDKWCASEVSHHSAYIFRGNYYIEQAWKHRGGGFSYTVTQDDWKKFRENLELAEKDLEKAYSMNPEDPNSATSMISVCLGLSRSEEDKETWFKRAIEADPVAYKAYGRKQNYLRPKWGGTKEKDRAFAEYCYEKAPPKSIIHEIMLDYIIENYKYTGNKDHYYSDPLIKKTVDDVTQRTLEIFPNSTSIRKKLAQIETDNEKYEKAVKLYSEILAIDPGNPEALRKRGRLYDRQLKKTDLAEADFKMSIVFDPYGPNNYTELAKIASMNYNYGKAIEYYTIAIKREPKALNLYLARGYIKTRFLNDYGAALEDFRKAEKIDNRSIPTCIQLAYCLEKMKRFKEAENYCLKTLSLIEEKKPREGDSAISIAQAEDYKKRLYDMLRRLETGSSRFPVSNSSPYPKTEIDYTIDPSPGEGWEKRSAGPFNDMAFALPDKLAMIYVGRISVFEGDNYMRPAEIFMGWIEGMQNKYDYKNFNIESSSVTTIDGRESYNAVYEFMFRDVMKKEKVYIIQGDSIFYRIRYNSNKNTFNENLQTFEDYFKSFKIKS